MIVCIFASFSWQDDTCASISPVVSLEATSVMKSNHTSLINSIESLCLYRFNLNCNLLTLVGRFFLFYFARVETNLWVKYAVQTRTSFFWLWFLNISEVEEKEEEEGTKYCQPITTSKYQRQSAFIRRITSHRQMRQTAITTIPPPTTTRTEKQRTQRIQKSHHLLHIEPFLTCIYLLFFSDKNTQ